MKKSWLYRIFNIKNTDREILHQIRKENYYVSLINYEVKNYFRIDEFYLNYKISLIETKLNKIKKENNKNNYYFEIFIYTSAPGILIGKAGQNIDRITKNLNDDIFYLKNDIKNNFIEKDDIFNIKITLKEILPINANYEIKIIQEYEKDCKNLPKL